MGFNRGIRDPTRSPEKRWPLISRRKASRLQRVGRIPRENLSRKIVEIELDRMFSSRKERRRG